MACLRREIASHASHPCGLFSSHPIYYRLSREGRGSLPAGHPAQPKPSRGCGESGPTLQVLGRKQHGRRVVQTVQSLLSALLASWSHQQFLTGSLATGTDSLSEQSTCGRLRAQRLASRIARQCSHVLTETSPLVKPQCSVGVGMRWPFQY